jgi:uncharacterized C2H2 Zn-finger protein
MLNQALIPYVSNKKTEDPLSREVQEMKKEIEHYKSKKDSQPIINVYNIPPEMKKYLEEQEKPKYYDPEKIKLIDEPPEIIEEKEEKEEKIRPQFEKKEIEGEYFLICPFCKQSIKVYKNTEFSKMKNHVNSKHINLMDEKVTTEYVKSNIV